MTKINAIRQQRPDRITLVLKGLEENGYIRSTIDTSDVKLYHITEKGFDAYLKWIKDFLSFVRTMNDEKMD
jgi:DNA-binding PadR family transcriptional regulator